MAEAPKGVAEIFDKAGVPPFVWVTIMTLESSGNPRALDGTGGTGLFQIQQNVGIAGSKYSTAQLQDPILNSQLTAGKMGPLYKKGVSQGLHGLDLVRYVAYNGGWPTQRGVNARFKDPVVMRYDIRLVKQFNLTGGSGTVPTIKADAGGHVSDNTKLETAPPTGDLAKPTGIWSGIWSGLNATPTKDIPGETLEATAEKAKATTFNYFAQQFVYVLVLLVLVGIVVYAVQKTFAVSSPVAKLKEAVVE